jgi:hypothetical protein
VQVEDDEESPSLSSSSSESLLALPFPIPVSCPRSFCQPPLVSAGELLFVGGGDDLLEPPPVDPELLSGSGSENIRVSSCYFVFARTSSNNFAAKRCERSYVPPGKRTRKRNLTRASAGAVLLQRRTPRQVGGRKTRETHPASLSSSSETVDLLLFGASSIITLESQGFLPSIAYSERCITPASESNAVIADARRPSARRDRSLVTEKSKVRKSKFSGNNLAPLTSFSPPHHRPGSLGYRAVPCANWAPAQRVLDAKGKVLLLRRLPTSSTRLPPNYFSSFFAPRTPMSQICQRIECFFSGIILKLDNFLL